MDRFGLAGLRPLGYSGAAADGGGSDLRPAICAVHVGRIAGEDDLDAPDLGGQPAEGSGKPGNGLNGKGANGNGADQPLGRFAVSRKAWSPPKQALEPETSAALRYGLLGEISALATQEQATAWAYKAMAAKNTLITVDC
jgi:hypothetical protein